MRKMIAFFIICFSSLLLIHGSANSKSSCYPGCKLPVKKVAVKTKKADKRNSQKADIHVDQSNTSLKPYDGFFFKI